MPARVHRRQVGIPQFALCAVVAVLGACDEQTPPAPVGDVLTTATEPTASVSSDPPTVEAKTGVTAKPTGSATAKKSDDQVAKPDAETADPSETMPSFEAFRSAKMLGATGATSLGCEVKFLQGWLRVLCLDTATGGKPTGLTVKSGNVDGKTSVTVRENKTLQLLTPVAEGTKVEAEFVWSDTTSTFVLDRSGGVAPDQVKGSFSGFKEFPSPKAFDTKGQEMVVNGGVELGCSAHTLNGWIKIQCGTLSKTAGKPKALRLTKGSEKGATKIWVIDNKMMTLVTPFTAGTELEGELEWSEAGTKRLSLAWPAGAALPLRVGGFDGFPDIPVRKEFAGKPTVNIERGLAHGCSSRTTRGWVRIVCEKTNATGGKPSGIEVLDGAKQDERLIETGTGMMALTVKVGAGSKLDARFKWTDQSLRLRIDWPNDKPQPDPLGRFDSDE